jgi:HSP20 family molecular chaperone IbpA
MFYTTSLSKFLDDTFAYTNKDILGHGYIYDSVKTEEGTTKIEVVVPGYSREELKLEVFHDILKLSCDTKGKQFVRKWKIDSSVDTETISAESRNGILTINLYKNKENSKTRHINIE